MLALWVVSQRCTFCLVTDADTEKARIWVSANESLASNTQISLQDSSSTHDAHDGDVAPNMWLYFQIL